MTVPDCSELLREGDALHKAGDFAAAARVYANAARIFEHSGQTLKAVAVLRQVRDVIAKHAPTERDLDADARARLPALYRALGLLDEAAAVEREP